MESVGNATAEGFGKVGQGFNKLAEATTSPFQPRVPIVEAREDALRDVPLGHEQALAYQQTRKQRRNFWISGPPADFKEPELPDQGGIADNGLLPPKLE